MSYYFSYVDEHAESLNGFPDKIVIRHPDECTWQDLPKVMPRFLQACGYVIPSHVSCVLIDDETGVEYKPSMYYDL